MKISQNKNLLREQGQIRKNERNVIRKHEWEENGGIWVYSKMGRTQN